MTCRWKQGKPPTRSNSYMPWVARQSANRRTSARAVHRLLQRRPVFRHACGNVVALMMTSHDVSFNSTSGDLSSTDPQMMPGGRLTSLFSTSRS